jgi:tetratricopeptide (TPR) repeat protein
LSVHQIGYWKNSRTLWEHALKVTRWNYVAENNLALVMLEEHQPDIALQHAQTAAQLNPKAPEVWCQLGNIYKAKENWPAALTNYEMASALSPKWLDIPLLLAQANEAVGNPAGAIVEYERALALDQNSTTALNNLAWLRATAADARLRDGQKAVALAEKASRLTTNSVPLILGTLAAAYAENSQFDQAVQTAERAAQIAMAKGDKGLADRNLELKKLYAERKPFRQ